jgi:hypothetical protein
MRYLTVAGYLVSLALCLALFICNAQTRHKEKALFALESHIATAAQDMHLMAVEWAYLTRPQRLASLSTIHLQDMAPVVSAQIAPSVTRLPVLEVAAVPSASIKVSALNSGLRGALNFRE